MASEKVALVSSTDSSSNLTHAQGQYGTLVEPESTGKWKARLQRVFPAGFMSEAKEVFRLAWPMYITNLLTFVSGPISMIFSGHLGRDELAAVAMSTSLFNVSGLSIVQGLTTACDTLFSQAYGGKNKKILGVYLQRSLIILALACMPCWVIYLNAHQLLLVLGQDPEVSRLTGDYLLIFLPGLLFTAMQQVLAKYLQIQGILKPLVLIGLLAIGLNILLQYLLVYVVQMGILGSALSQDISYFVMLVLTILYILLWKKYKATWPGWSWKCLENWGIFIKLAISGLFMIILEWWTFEIGIFLSGLLGTAELGASSILFQIEGFLFLVSFSLGVSSSIRVGYNLGSGNADGAKTASRVALVLSFMAYIVEGILVFSLMSVAPYVFTSDVAVAELTSSMMPIVAFIIYFDSITAVSMGIIRGAGRQIIGAVVNVASYTCIALPMVVVLMFVVKIGPAGFWWGVTIGQLPAAIVYLIIVARMNWKREVDKVSTRILATDMVNSVEVTGHDGITNQKSPLLDASTSLAKSNAIGNVTTLTQPHPDGTRIVEDETDIDDVKPVSESLYYLILKRVAVVFVLLSILVAGILARVLIPVAEASFNNRTLTNNTDQMPVTDNVLELYNLSRFESVTLL